MQVIKYLILLKIFIPWVELRGLVLCSVVVAGIAIMSR